MILIISDIHLGSKASRSKDLLKFLKTKDFDTLILNGDIFGDLNLSRLSCDDFKFLSYLNKISGKKKVVWIEGNHDAGLTRILSSLIGIDVYLEYGFFWKHHYCVATHGHQFDGVVSKYPSFAKLISFVFMEIQKIPFIRKPLAIFLDKITARWQRLGPVVAERAIQYAKENKINIIFCGHTHEPYYKTFEGIEYYNSGCWTEDQCGYLELTDDGWVLEGVYESKA